MKKIKPLWWIVGTIAVLAAVGFIWLNNAATDKAAYRFDRVDRGSIVVSISATGTLNAVTTVLVGSQVSGTIAKLYADFNSVVKEGQLLAQLDPTFLQATVNEQRANKDRSTAQMHEAQRNFDRTTDLFGKSLVSQADMDAATTTLESAKASLKQTEASLERAEVNMRYATIRAPIGGVVISRSVDVGQTVAASLQAPTLFTIANDLRKMQVQASVDEADIGNVKAGQSVTFRVDAFAEEEFKGVVSQIRLAPTITQNVVTYTVIVDVDNPQQKLMPGMTATMTIEVERKDDVLRVPLLALRFTPPDEELEKLSSNGEASPEGKKKSDSLQPGDRSQSAGGEPRNRQGVRGNQAGGDRATRMPRSGGMNKSRVWVLKEGKLKSLRVQRGVQNTQYAEVSGADIKEGDEVIIGVVGAQTTMAPSGQNPFMPQQGQRGGGGGRRGF